MAHPDALSPLALFSRLFADRQPVVLDIRVSDDISEHPGWIPAAHRVAFDDLPAQLALTDARAPVVVVCHGGLKLSQGVAARLCLHERRAGFLRGGLLGWRAADLPLIDAAPGLWASDGTDIAAEWLAKRLLPLPSEILRVEPGQVALVADRFGGSVLPDAEALLALCDRPIPALKVALHFAQSPDFARLTGGGCDGFALLDAWALGGEVAT